MDKYDPTQHQIATFAGGSFWALEHVFDHLKGVFDARVGYTGGHVANPTHEQVRSGKTGHAEAVEVMYDPDVISYDQLLETFWNAHDPTQLNRQGPDIGPEFRSAIFYHNAEQCQAAERSRAVLMKLKRFRNPIVTVIAPAGVFYPAAEKHQHYIDKENAQNRPWTYNIAENIEKGHGFRTK